MVRFSMVYFFMMEKLLSRLEDFLYNFYGEENRKNVCAVIACILGVLIGLKPAALLINDVLSDGRMLLDNGEFEVLLSQLNLKMVVGSVSRFTEKIMTRKTGKYQGHEFLYISLKGELCLELKRYYEEMVNLSCNGFAMKGEEKEWTELTSKIGKLLGYPKTAILEFVSKNGDEEYVKDVNRMERIKRNRYYAHSEVFEDEEFEEYDLLLNLAIKQYLPHTAAIMQADSKKRWLG